MSAAQILAKARTEVSDGANVNDDKISAKTASTADGMSIKSQPVANNESSSLPALGALPSLGGGR